MAVPSNVRVEATSITTTVLRWDDSSGNNVGIYRALGAGSYSLIATNTIGVTTYTDTGLTTGTLYHYKLSNDLGSTFSAIVDVVTHTCVGPADGRDNMNLPRATGAVLIDGNGINFAQGNSLVDPSQGNQAAQGGGAVTASEFNELADTVETAMQTRILKPTQCEVCPVNGAIVIDCSNGCHDFVIDVTADINSISVNWCNTGNGTIDFLIPPGTTRRICGWPGAFGFSGDECTQAPISGGTNGRTMRVPISNTSARAGSTSSNPTTSTGAGEGSGGGGGGGSGSTCTCVPNGNGALTIKCCNAGCSLKCGTSKSLTLRVCGGRGPYSWSRTGSVLLKGSTNAPNASPTSTATGSSVTVTPPTNSSPGTGGTAYMVYATKETLNPCGSSLNFNVEQFGCNDNDLSLSAGGANVSFSACGAVIVTNTVAPSCHNSGGGGANCPTPDGTCDNATSTGGPALTALAAGSATTCDNRSGAMISAGCAPCGLVGGNTVSVTDSIGTVATIILRA